MGQGFVDRVLHVHVAEGERFAVAEVQLATHHVHVVQAGSQRNSELNLPVVSGAASRSEGDVVQ
eukprot:7864161-Prorocentrum_lima.AAC.1